MKFLFNTRKDLRKIIKNSVSFFLILLFFIIINSYFIQISHVSSSSMEPTIRKNSFVLINKISLKNTSLKKTIKRNQLIALHWPLEENTILVKRIVAIPGDKICCIKNHFYFENELIGKIPTDIKQEALIKEGFLIKKKNEKYKAHLDDFCNLEIPKESYFVMGDNRENSSDSRSWGLIHEEKIIGFISLV